GEENIVHERDVVADAGVVAEVAGDHQEAVVTHGRGAIGLAGEVDRDALPDPAVAPDLDAGGGVAVLPLDVLRREAQGGEGVDAGVLADFDGAADLDVGEQAHACGELDAPADDAV